MREKQRKKRKNRTKDEKKMTDQTKKEEKKIHKTRKMNQHGNFGLDLRKSCDPGVQGWPRAFQSVGFGTTLRPCPKPQVTPLDKYLLKLIGLVLHVLACQILTHK
jgi:hypothetical protein